MTRAQSASRLDRIAGTIRSACLTLAAVGLLTIPSALAQAGSSPIPRFDGRTHLGVAACAGPCHARQPALGITEAEAMRGSEVNVWQDRDSIRGRHSEAFRSLLSARGREMAARLGLEDASKAPECLSCHSDAAPARGPRFQISDGVGCEACHGGAEAWISRHYAPTATHASNISLGLYPTHDPVARVRLCATCHIGTKRKDQFATHAMMAAGHPRLVLETELFTSLQAHHFEDETYLSRKPAVSRARIWAIGQAISMETTIETYLEGEQRRLGAFPEPAFFDCRSCHRPISDAPPLGGLAALNPFRASAPGDIPFNDAYVLTLMAAAQSFAPAEAKALEKAARDFHRSLKEGPEDRRRKGIEFAARLSRLAEAFGRADFSDQTVRRALTNILSDNQGLNLTSYAGAEQAVMAVDTLTRALADNGALSSKATTELRRTLKQAYAELEDPNAYRQSQFIAQMNDIAASLDLR
ncbi:MAG: cytochrome c family protein [Alphaproteobacteria bacterium]|nr:cytochrome c family protein [Alphaproteobacteria bacterium]